jgi:hypothetical protein
MSATSLDIDKDGDNDLIVTRTSSIWLYTNEGGKLTGHKLDAPIANDTTPLSIAVADLNRDGAFDMYVSGYIKKTLIEGVNIFNKEGYGGTSALLINNGDNTFTDKTKESGLYYKHNTFQAVFYDADNDGDEDLIVAHDTGQVRTWKNLGNGKFENTPNPTSEVYSYPMGIGVADYDNDGLVDFFFSNTGTTAPPFIARGDLRDDQVYSFTTRVVSLSPIPPNTPNWLATNSHGAGSSRTLTWTAELTSQCPRTSLTCLCTSLRSSACQADSSCRIRTANSQQSVPKRAW